MADYYVDKFTFRNESGDLSGDRYLVKDSLLTKRVDKLESDIDAKQIKLQKRKWFLFGDSIAAISTGFTSILKKRFGDDYFGFSAAGSMKYSDNPVENYLVFSNMLDSWLPTIQDAESYTDIFIELGSNDVVNYSEKNFDSGFSSAINKIKNHFTNANIHCGIVGKQMREKIYNTRQQVIYLLKKNCGEHMCAYVEGAENILGGKFETFDTIHPTEDGHLKIANALTSYFLGGACTQSVLSNRVKTGSLQGLEVTECYNEGIYNVNIVGTITNATGFDIPSKLGVVGTKIGEVSLDYCYRNVTLSGWIQADLTVFGQNVCHSVPCVLAIIPRDDSSTTCDVLMAISYNSYYRDSAGATKDWENGFKFTTGIINVASTSIPA